MSDLDDRIDELYGLPLAEFTASRNALAKTLKGEEAAAIKRLEKPSVVAWSANQLYWRDRRTFDKLMASGRDLRSAQIAALKGRSSDLREATSTHRTALAAALAAATNLAKESGANPSSEALARMLEALSLAPDLPASPGRFTEQLQPAGFEALAGITPAARPHIVAPPAPGTAGHRDRAGKKTTKADEAEGEHRRAEAEAEKRAAAEGALGQARKALDRAQATETRAASQVDAARRQLEVAEAALEQAHKVATGARREVDRHELAVKALTATRPKRR